MPGQETPDGAAISLADQVDAFERTLIERCLTETGGRINAVMERLSIPRRTLSEKMARYGLDRRRFVESDGPNTADETEPLGGKLPVR
jgi:two-component system C4-dicarboxylate transport response regulator DctD